MRKRAMARRASSTTMDPIAMPAMVLMGRVVGGEGGEEVPIPRTNVDEEGGKSVEECCVCESDWVIEFGGEVV
jgi:hypothetical protein